MDIKVVHEDGLLTKYLIKGTTSTFMNSLRRAIMCDVPCLAVDTVHFYENDSVVFDEMLAHRLGLLPVKTDVKTYKKGDKVKLVLEKLGPGIVTSKDIKCTDPKIEIVDKKIPITKLGKEQKIKVEMNAIMGTGADHAKFQPALIAYNEVPIIDNEKTYANAKEIVAEFPEGVIEAKAGKLFLLDPYNIKIQNQFGDLLAKHGVKLRYSSTDFVMTLETTGQLSSKEVVEAGLRVLGEKLD
ncbi:MAG: DNA-directed RNA polymerase subunit D, partial [archaeon]